MINTMKASQGMHTVIEPTVGQLVKIVIFGMNLQRHRMAMRLQVVVKNPAEI